MQNASFAPTFRITNRITAGLTHIERARGFLEAATLSENWVREMGNRALVLEAYHTTHIEGTRLTLDQAERMPLREALRGNRLHAGTPLMVVDHPAGRIALSAEQMTYHHTGQGDFKGEPWMVSF